jgi:hypothetical protein
MHHNGQEESYFWFSATRADGHHQDQRNMMTPREQTHRIVSEIFVSSYGDSALNWIICPEDKGNEGL